MKVLFMNFNLGATCGINHGLAVLSAVLKKNSHKVELIFLCEELGYCFDLKRIRDDILSINPDVIGISLMETQHKYAVEFCKDLSSYYNGFIICGGAYPTMDPEACLAMPGVRAVCVGEGEETLVELIDALELGKDYKNIKNLWVKLPDGSIVKNKLRPFKSLTELPPEDIELFDLKKILPIKKFQLEAIIGRGCVHQCSYCINASYLEQYRRLGEEPFSANNFLRAKNLDTVLAEIKDAVSKHSEIEKIAFVDDNFLLHQDLKNFCMRFRREIGLPFICNVNPLSLDISKAKLLNDCGCEVIRLGVESGSERIKKEIMKRPISNQRISEASQIASDSGLKISFYNMIGLPTESKEELFETLRLNASLQPDFVKVMTFYPFKKTALYDLCETLNLIDCEKRETLDNYDTFSCLHFAKDYKLFLEKIQMAFNWYLNLFLNNIASLRYGELISMTEKMNEAGWKQFDFLSVDEEVSNEFKKRGILHYRKFINRSLAIKVPGVST